MGLIKINFFTAEFLKWNIADNAISLSVPVYNNVFVK